MVTGVPGPRAATDSNRVSAPARALLSAARRVMSRRLTPRAVVRRSYHAAAGVMILSAQVVLTPIRSHVLADSRWGMIRAGVPVSAMGTRFVNGVIRMTGYVFSRLVYPGNARSRGCFIRPVRSCVYPSHNCFCPALWRIFLTPPRSRRLAPHGRSL